MYVRYHHQKTRSRQDVKAAQITVESPGGLVRLSVRNSDVIGTALLTVPETVALIEGLLSAFQRCGVSLDEHNAIVQGLEAVAG